MNNGERFAVSVLVPPSPGAEADGSAAEAGAGGGVVDGIEGPVGAEAGGLGVPTTGSGVYINGADCARFRLVGA